jgi:acyl-CoA reductase-like NAD-dependent aldehyde dehydrogenase
MPPSVTGDHRIPSLGSFVRGKDVDSSRWVYTLSSRAVLDDSFASLTLKRRLESGAISPDEVPPGVVVGRVALAEKETLDDALSAAAEAARIWRSVSLSTRLDDWMNLLRATLQERRDEFVRMLVLEGHPVAVARWEFSGMMELTRQVTTDFLRGHLWQECVVDGRRNIVRRQADGVVCVSPPANAPLVSALLGTLSIVGGNAVVVRAPRTAPFSVSHILRNVIAPALDELGAPPGTINVVCGNPGLVLDGWIASPHVNDIMYFGDVARGLKVERRCIDVGKKPILELAGNDVVLVWKDADLDRAADALAESFYGSGQLCMVPNQAVVHPAVADELIDRVVVRAQALRPGYPDEEGVLLSPVLRHDRFEGFLAQAVSVGATVLTGGHGMQIDGSRDRSGFFIEPTVVRIDGLRGVRGLDIVREETFFPLLPIIVPEPRDDEVLFDAFIEFVNSNRFGLRNSLWARDRSVIDRFVAEIVAGGLLKVNDSHIAFAAPLPSHGGTGLTGGAFGEANYPVLRTTHLQGVSIATGSEMRKQDAVTQ